MDYKNLKEGLKIYFEGENLPMELIARTENYACVVRSLDIEEDYDLIYHEVERGSYYDTKEAYEDFKDDPVYSLLDFKNHKKAPTNRIFYTYDFWSKKDCKKACKDLEKEKHALSKRYGTELKIDWKRTLNKSNI